ncbi:hypothetical protein CEXT_598901 [Caerostris extrusa]|uniref:Uncharacterized protein n=1 Tax=Caerostris extrusa TaxID=172846 RepID=A0AAV4MYU2_CAEEX|nr:hypothetical protein CEXT_598901 [Caerostris extrusa]
MKGRRKKKKKTRLGSFHLSENLGTLLSSAFTTNEMEADIWACLLRAKPRLVGFVYALLSSESHAYLHCTENSN